MTGKNLWRLCKTYGRLIGYNKAYAAEVDRAFYENNDGAVSAFEGDVDSAAGGFADNARLFLPATTFNRGPGRQASPGASRDRYGVVSFDFLHAQACSTLKTSGAWTWSSSVNRVRRRAVSSGSQPSAVCGSTARSTVRLTSSWPLFGLRFVTSTVTIDAALPAHRRSPIALAATAAVRTSGRNGLLRAAESSPARSDSMRI